MTLGISLSILLLDLTMRFFTLYGGGHLDRHKLTVFYPKSFDMDSVQVGKAVFGKEIYTTLGIEPRTYS